MSATNEVRAASARFYDALNLMANGDATPMSLAWDRDGQVSAQHPIGGRDEGYETVIASFARVAEIAGGGDIRLLDQRFDVGSDMAVETGLETGTLIIAGNEVRIHHRVTNVYRRNDGDWKLAHHHADQSPAMLDILKRLSEAA